MDDQVKSTLLATINCDSSKRGQGQDSGRRKRVLIVFALLLLTAVIVLAALFGSGAIGGGNAAASGDGTLETTTMLSEDSAQVQSGFPMSAEA